MKKDKDEKLTIDHIKNMLRGYPTLSFSSKATNIYTTLFKTVQNEEQIFERIRSLILKAREDFPEVCRDGLGVSIDMEKRQAKLYIIIEDIYRW